MPINWRVPNKSVADVKSALDSQMSQSGLPSFVSTRWDQDELLVRIEKAGKSEFRLAFKSEGSDVKVVESKRDVALFHRPFVDKVETSVADLLTGIGAVKS